MIIISFLILFVKRVRNNSSKASLASRVRNSSIDGNTDLRAGETTNNRYFAAFPRRVKQKPRKVDYHQTDC